MKILFVPSVGGGTTLNPLYVSHHLDDLGLVNSLAAQGHDVWVAPRYIHSKKAGLLWPKTTDFLFDPGLLNEFDEVYVFDRFGNTLHTMENPGNANKRNYILHTDLVINALDKFDGPIKCVKVDGRPKWERSWNKDRNKEISNYLKRDFKLVKDETAVAFGRVMARIECRPITDEEDRWSAKWVVENMLGNYLVDKTYDFIFDGASTWDSYSRGRREQILSLVNRFPDCATAGKLKIDGLEQFKGHNRFINFQGCGDLAWVSNRARYKLLSWEPFHFEWKRLWTPRTMFALASDSLAFSLDKNTPFLECEVQSIPTLSEELVAEQQQLLRDFAQKDPWPCPLK